VILILSKLNINSSVWFRYLFVVIYMYPNSDFSLLWWFDALVHSELGLNSKIQISVAYTLMIYLIWLSLWACVVVYGGWLLDQNNPLITIMSCNRYMYVLCKVGAWPFPGHGLLVGLMYLDGIAVGDLSDCHCSAIKTCERCRKILWVKIWCLCLNPSLMVF
jgi:hypothetical protein